MSSTTAPASGNSRQNAAPNRSHKSPERPRGGRSRRTLIESACTACQKRKSRCDGQRPTCSRCQALNTECGYNAEEGESRWSALRRRNRTLERERDEARDLIAHLQSRPEREAQQILHRLRMASHVDNPGALIHETLAEFSDNAIQQQHQSQPQQQHSQQIQNRYYDPQAQHQPLQQDYNQHQHQQTAQRQQQAQQPGQGIFAQPSYTATTSSTQLPPIRSIVEVPTGGLNSAHLPLPPPLTQRNMSQVSAMSSGSYTSLSSSDGRGGQSVSPRENPQPRWAHGSSS